jgi:hypothetical protein
MWKDIALAEISLSPSLLFNDPKRAIRVIDILVLEKEISSNGHIP